MKRIKDIINNFIDIISRSEMRILPGNLAFFLVLSVIPIISLIGIICSQFSISLLNLDVFQNLLPKGVIEVLQPFLTSNANSSHLVVLLILGFIIASNGAHAIILSSNTLYNIDSSNYLVRRIKAFFLTIVLMILFVFVLVVLAFGNIIFKFILDLGVFSNIVDNIYSTFVFFKWPIAFIVVFLMIKILYTMAPDKRILSKYVNKGAFFTTCGWMLITAVYSFYANNIADYSRFYGSLSNIAILMMWIYIISYIFVVGIAINTSYYDYEANMKEDKKLEKLNKILKVK